MIMPLLVIGLSAFFAFVSFTVFVTNGKSKKWIARKMKIGGLLLTLTAAVSASGQEIHPSCYEMAAVETDIITMKNIGSEKMDYEKLREIQGNVSERASDHFSFCLINYFGTKVYSDNIKALDGKFEEPDEDFSIRMPDKLPEGQYQLVFYSDSKNNQRKENEKSRFIISL